MIILLKAIYRFYAIPIKTPLAFFRELEKIIRHLYGNTKDPPTAKTILSKKDTDGSILLPDFTLYYKSTEIKTVLYWHKNRHIRLNGAEDKVQK